MGDSFALKINMTRQIEEPTYSEEDIILQTEKLYNDKAFIQKWEKNQFGFPEEEESGEEEQAGEGEGEGESESE
jgi:hypothetical protein